MDTDVLPVNLPVPKSDSKAPLPAFKPISKHWKIFISIILFINTLLFLHAAYLYSEYIDKLVLLPLVVQSNALVAITSIIGIFVSIAVCIIYLYFRKRRSGEQSFLPTSIKWKLLFTGLAFLYLLLFVLLSLSSGGILVGLSVITDTIIATFNVVVLLIYFDRHKPRKAVQILGKTVIYLSLVFIAVGILLQTLSALSFFFPGNPQ